MITPNCIVLAERFPNIYESYILNQIEFLIQHGGEVAVVSGPPLGKRFDARIAQYGLQSRNFTYAFDSLSDWRAALRPFIRVRGRHYSVCRGVRRLLGTSRFRQLDAKRKVKALVKSPVVGSSSRFDLIHSHRVFLAKDNLYMAEALGVPLVVSFHGLQTTDLSRPFFLDDRDTRDVFEGARVFTAGTEYAKSILVHYGCPAEKILILPVGIDLSRFPFNPRPYSPSRTIVLLTVARLSPEKGHEDVISAVKAVKDRGWNVEYRIVGDGPHKERLKSVVERLNVSDFVRFVGEKENEGLIEEYREADVFILGSTKGEGNVWYGETQGLAIQEAQASGTLVIATNVGGIPECVDSEHSVLLVPERDPVALAGALERLLESPEDWPGRQQAGREWVERRFSMQVLGKRLLDVYAKATREAGRGYAT